MSASWPETSRNASAPRQRSPDIEIIVRSLVFNVAFYLVTLLYLVAALPTFLMSRHGILGIAWIWSHTVLQLLRIVCNMQVEWRGLDRIPPGPLLVASKHQSAWEVFGLIVLFPDFAFILKRELQWIPWFGWYTIKARMIPVIRGARSKALAALTESVSRELAAGRQIIIFPEGTRRSPGAEPAYKYGIVHLYATTGATCLPIALNSGLFWPRRSFLRYPGKVIIEVLDPIPPGLDPGAFAARLQSAIEPASARLLLEATEGRS